MRPEFVNARICRLTLSNFRSYHAANIAVAGNLVVLVGPNGAGKTNLLEAISLLSPGRGLRRAEIGELAFNEGDGSWAVSAEVDGALGLATLGTGIEPPGGAEAAPLRKYRIDREPAGSAAAFADHLRVVWLVPAMDGLFAGPASERRRFLDRLVLAVDAAHAARVSALERALRSRNRLLESPRPDAHWLDAAEHETAEIAVAVAAARAETVRRLAAALAARRAAETAFPVRRDRARRLDGGHGAGPARRRGGGPLPRRAARQSRPRCRRRAHPRRPPSHRPRRRITSRKGSPRATPPPASRRRC